MVVYYHELEYHAVCYLQGQGHTNRLYNQNVTISAMSYNSGRFATKLYLIVQHHMPECPVKK